ncbi:MAG: zf-HC2 domain-containing protein [Pseudomonadota bacterium]
MDTKHTNQLSREEAFELLPWHVNGSLSDELNQQVIAHLEVCPELRAEAALLASTVFATNADEPKYGQVDESFKALMNRIDADERQEELSKTPDRPWRQWLSGLVPTSRWSQAFSAAMLVVLGLAVGLVLQPVSVIDPVPVNPAEDPYRVLAGVKEPLILSLQFSDDVDEMFVKGLVASVVNEYRVEQKSQRRYLVFLPKKTDAGEITALLKTLNNNAQVQRIEIVADSTEADK